MRSQTSERDRLSLLALHNACREFHGSFAYLEIGSYLGGSLQVLVVDPRCTSIVSIDPGRSASRTSAGIRVPQEQHAGDARSAGGVPGADLTKLQTIEASVEDVVVEQLPATPVLCLIDGEHTVEAALRDARFCRQAIGHEGAIVFHDRRLVRPAIERFLEELADVPHEGYPLLGSVYVVEVGETRLRPAVDRLLAGQEEPKPFLMEHPARRFP